MQRLPIMPRRGTLVTLVFWCGCAASGARGDRAARGPGSSDVPETKHHVPTIPSAPPAAGALDGARPRLDVAEVTVNILAEADRVGLEQLPVEQRTVATVWLLSADVDNGGFDQYFFNASGDLAPFASGAFAEIGAPAVAEIVAEAVGVFGEDGPATDQAQRHKQMERLAPSVRRQWAELDAKFLRHSDAIPGLLRSYVATHDDELAIGSAPASL
jgi:hypothetical protein